MKLKLPVLLLPALLLVLSNMKALAQPDVALLRDLAEENKKSVEALVLYPPETRLAILEATRHPEVLIKMQDMREKTSAAFRALIEDFPRETQEVFYNLSRYSGMAATLVAQKNDPNAQRKTLEALPEEKRAATLGVVSRQIATLEKINDLNQTSSGAFKRLIAEYPAPAQQAFENLLDLPEVIDLLNEDLRFTILVGETYEDNPSWVVHQMDSLNLAVAQTHAEELQNWKTTLENDPEARTELQAASQEYAAENGYPDDDNDDWYDRNDDVVVYNQYYSPYPYWYGYPWWEPYPRWHPYPWWWDWGYRFPPNGVVIVYLPSYHFMHWYFDRPQHHVRYNHLSTHFVNHYNGHRRSGTTISMGVREWQDKNRKIVSDDFISDNNRLPERLKEYGKFEESRQEYNHKNPRNPVEQEAYLDKNTKKFPEIARSREVAKKEITRENQTKRDKAAKWAPEKAPAKPEPAPEPRIQRPPRVAPTPAQKVPNTREPAPAQRPKTQPDEAKDYHRQNWEEKKQPQAPRSNPAPRSAPKATPRTEKAQPTKRGKIGN